MSLSLSMNTPRTYPLIEGFRGRVWRNAFNLYARECALLCTGIALFSFLLDATLWLEIGILGLISTLVLAGLATAYINYQRVGIIRHGTAVKAELLDKKKLRLWHEMLRPKAHRSFKITYRFHLEGHTHWIESSFYLCRCAYDHLQKHESLIIAYHHNNIQRNVPLRVAVMRIPH